MINISGVISIVLFYLLILGVGIWAARKKQAGNDSEEEVMLAGRSIGLFVGIFTMTGNYYPCSHTLTWPKFSGPRRKYKIPEIIEFSLLTIIINNTTYVLLDFSKQRESYCMRVVCVCVCYYMSVYHYAQ